MWSILMAFPGMCMYLTKRDDEIDTKGGQCVAECCIYHNSSMISVLKSSAVRNFVCSHLFTYLAFHRGTAELKYIIIKVAVNNGDEKFSFIS